MNEFDFKTQKLLDEFLVSTQISEYYLDELLKENNIKYSITERGKAIKLDDYSKLIRSENFKKYYLNTLQHAIERNNTDNIESNKKIIKTIIDHELLLIRANFELICEFHKSFVRKYDLIREESAEVASCLLLGKAISMFGSYILCTTNTQLNAIIFIRPINEALNLSVYFLYEKAKDNGNEALFNWFRNSKTPTTNQVNNSLEEFTTKYIGKGLSKFTTSIRSQLIQSSSKIIHNSFVFCIKDIKCKLESERCEIEKIELETTTNQREILLNVVYAQSLLITIYQTYLECIKLLMTDTSIEQIEKLERKTEEIAIEICESRGKMQLLGLI